MIKGIIFDMDGVICDSMHQHNSIEIDIINRFGNSVSEKELREKYAGIPFYDTLALLTKKDENTLKQLMKEKIERFSLVVDNIGLMTGFESFYDKIKRHFVLSIASGSNRIFIDKILNNNNIRIPIIVSDEDVEKGKPDPEIFLLACKKMGLKPGECVVIEDGTSGMIGAKNAGMKVVALSDDVGAPADIVIKHFDELSLESIKNLN